MCVCVYFIFQSSVLPYLIVTVVPVLLLSSVSKRCCPPVPLLIVPLLSLFSWSSPCCCPPAAHPAQGHGRRPSCRWLYPGIEACVWGWIDTSWNIDTIVVSHTWYVTIARTRNRPYCSNGFCTKLLSGWEDFSPKMMSSTSAQHILRSVTCACICIWGVVKRRDLYQ